MDSLAYRSRPFRGYSLAMARYAYTNYFENEVLRERPDARGNLVDIDNAKRKVALERLVVSSLPGVVETDAA